MTTATRVTVRTMTTATRVTVRTMANVHSELPELLQALRPGKQLRRDYVENRAIVYEFFQRRHVDQRAQGARQCTFSWSQLAAAFYDDVEPKDPEAARRRRQSLRNMVKDLAAVGLIAWGPLCSAEGRRGARGQRQAGGKFVCLWFELQDVEAALHSVRSGAPAGIAQSVRATPWRRAPESRQQRRERVHRRYCRTGGHRRRGGVEQSGFLTTAPAVFFEASQKQNWPSGGFRPLKGAGTHDAATPQGVTPGKTPAPRPQRSPGGSAPLRPLDLALRRALSGHPPGPAVEGTEGGGGSNPTGRLSIELAETWRATIGPADALPADLADALDHAADAFDRIRLKRLPHEPSDPPGIYRYTGHHAADARACRPLYRLHLAGVPASRASGPSAPSPAEAVPSTPPGAGSAAIQGTRPADSAEPRPLYRGGTTAALHEYARVLALDFTASIDRYHAWRRRQHRRR